MGLVIGTIMGFLGIGMLVVPFLIDVYQSRKQTTTNDKRALEASAGLIVIATIFMIGGLLLVSVVSTWGVAKAGIGGLSGGFEGKPGGAAGGGEGAGGGGGNNALLTYMLLKQRGEGAEAAEGAEGVEAAEGAEAGGLAAEAGELAEFA